MHRGQSLCLAGSVALLFGAFLPWETIESTVLGASRSMAGLQGDSIIAAGAGLILFLVAMTTKGTAGKRYSRFAVVLALIAGFVVVIYLPAAANGTKPGSGIIVTSGPGLYLSLIGSVLALVGGLQTVPGILAAVQSPAPAPPPINHLPTPVAPAARPEPTELIKESTAKVIMIALVAWAVLALLVVVVVTFGGR